MNRCKQSGFSLVELMVALAVFSVISAASFIGLNSALRSYTFFTGEARNQSRVETFIALVTRDFIQVAPRIVRDANGDYQPALSLGGEFLVEFSRGGRPVIGQSTGLSRVAYKLDEDKIWRYTWNYLDNIRTSEPSKALVLDNVEQVSITAIDDSLNERSQWPESRSFSYDDYVRIPQAVQLELQIEGEGKFGRFIPGVSSVYRSEDDQQQSKDTRSVDQTRDTVGS